MSFEAHYQHYILTFSNSQRCVFESTSPTSADLTLHFHLLPTFAALLPRAPTPTNDISTFGVSWSMLLLLLLQALCSGLGLSQCKCTKLVLLVKIQTCSYLACAPARTSLALSTVPSKNPIVFFDITMGTIEHQQCFLFTLLMLLTSLVLHLGVSLQAARRWGAWSLRLALDRVLLSPTPLAHC